MERAVKSTAASVVASRVRFTAAGDQTDAHNERSLRRSRVAPRSLEDLTPTEYANRHRQQGLHERRILHPRSACFGLGQSRAQNFNVSLDLGEQYIRCSDILR
jgi:hypothetical protein